MFQRIRLFIQFGITGIAMCTLLSAIAHAQSATKAEGTTFVGRGGKVTITDKHGAQVVEGGRLRPVNRITTVTPAPTAPTEGETAASTEANPVETAPANSAQPEGEGEKVQDPSKPVTETKPGDVKESPKDTTTAKPGDQKKTDVETAAAVSAEEAKKKAAAKAIEQAIKDARRQKDIAQLRSIQQTGGWFYTKDGKAISNEELNERIKKGKVEDIKATDIYEEQYSTDSSDEKGKKKTTK